jgi:phospholipase C
MKRRDALKTLGTLAGATAASRLLTGCDDGGSGSPPGISTIVVVCMENRSYDHFLGARALEGLGGDGLGSEMSNQRLDGSSVAVYPETIACMPDPPHGWDSCHAQAADGENSGFLTEFERYHGAGAPPHAMGYFDRAAQPFSWALADHYATSDRWFSSVLGPTWPNRMYLHSGQSGGLKVNELPVSGGIDWRSIHHQLNDAGIEWAYYFQDLPFVPLYKDLDIEGRVRRFNYDFFKDAEAGTLPPVVWIEPNTNLNDDHPPHHHMLGQQFLASIYTALATSPQWENCLLVVTYDEHGGFYDHVAPPKAPDARADEGFDQLGIRVPTFVAGPYVKTGYVDSEVREHCSVLAHITKMFDLEPLTERVAWAKDLDSFLDLERLAEGRPNAPVEMPEIVVDENAITDACYRLVPGQPELEALADAGFFPSHLDRRGHRREDALAIAEFLRRHGAGGLVGD